MTRVTERTRASQPAWIDHPGLVAYYTRHRSRPAELYPSERRFLPWLAAQAPSVLDVGCAAGGFRDVWRHYQPRIAYTGVDRSPALLRAAAARHPDATFVTADCAAGLPLAGRSAVVVQALGWLHWEPRYRRALAELWRVSDRYLFFDVRVHNRVKQPMRGTQRLAFEGPWDGRTRIPYLVLPWARLARELLALRPRAMFGYGYWGPPADTVRGVGRRVCLAAFVLERAPHGQPSGVPVVCVDLPLGWPAALSGQVKRIPGSQLDQVLGLGRPRLSLCGAEA